MLDEIEFPIFIQLVFRYLNTDKTIYEITELEECKKLSIPFTKCLARISSNKTIHYNGKKYLWSDLSTKVREKMEKDKQNYFLGLAIIYLEGDYTLKFLASVSEVKISSSSLQRYFKELIPTIPTIEYNDTVYTGEEFAALLDEKMAIQKSKAPQKGGREFAIKNTVLKDQNGKFIGSEKKKRIAGKHFPDTYERAKFEAELMKFRHSSTQLIGDIQGFRKVTIQRDFHEVLKNSNPSIYEGVWEQLQENKNVVHDEKGLFLNAEEKYRRQK